MFNDDNQSALRSFLDESTDDGGGGGAGGGGSSFEAGALAQQSVRSNIDPEESTPAAGAEELDRDASLPAAATSVHEAFPSLPRTAAQLSSTLVSLGNEYTQSRKEHYTLLIVLLTVTAALGGFLFGYDTGVISGAMLLIGEDFELSDRQEEVVVSITTVSAAVASVAGGPAMQRWGRRPVILFAGVVFTLGAIILAAALSYAALVAGRLVVGVGIGLASLTTPVYIAEAAPSTFRGKLVTVNTLFITVGQMVAGVVAGLFSDTEGGWRYMLGLSAVPAILLIVGFLYLPESPRWLVSTGMRTKALEILQAIRGESDVYAELQEIVETVMEQGGERLKKAITVARLLQNRRTKRALALGCGMQLLQQLCGINTIMYYSATICRMAGFGQETSIWLTAVTAAAQSAGVAVGTRFVENYGRRPLVLSSLALVVVSLLCLGGGFVLYDSASSSDEEVYGWGVVVAMMVYLFTFGLGLSPVPWVFNSEAYSNNARSLGTSASTTTNWVGNALVSATFLSLTDSALGTAGTFCVYAVIAAIGWVLLYVFMPETKGIPLELAELLFARDGDPVDEDMDGDDEESPSGGEKDGIEQHPGAVMNGTQHRADGFALLDDSLSNRNT